MGYVCAGQYERVREVSGEYVGAVRIGRKRENQSCGSVSQFAFLHSGF